MFKKIIFLKNNKRFFKDKGDSTVFELVFFVKIGGVEDVEEDVATEVDVFSEVFEFGYLVFFCEKINQILGEIIKN